MEKKIDFQKIEKKWQKAWEDKKAFKTNDKSKKEKYYVLEMYPYPSASGLHMGHAFNYTIGDILARYMRMNGKEVLYPMGYDSFGLPAENAAIKAKSHPKKFTEEAIKNFIKQQKALGLSYDWSRKIQSHDENYYKWNQWLFLKMYEKGLVYRQKSKVNWCEDCNTVLANEQVHNGKCWRHSNREVVEKDLDQWFIKTTEYADELLDGIDDLDWPNRIKAMQKNWIGRSEGVDIYFPLEESEEKLTAYTTRCDTIYSVTFLAIAPESPLVGELTNGTKYEKGAREFVNDVKKDSIIDRTNEEKAKKGFFTGKYAINPASKEKIPIYIANFALMYGSGVVMCDAHDKRDFEFAKKYKVPLKFVISKDGKKVDANKADGAYLDDGILFDSGKFSGMKNREALPKIADWLEKERMGKKTINYKLRDWLVSRQRYWGTPIPMYYDKEGNALAADEKDLPIELPQDIKFGKGNPLETSKKFVEFTKNGKKYRRETDTMDTFFDSSWYYLRFIDPLNGKKVFDSKKADRFMPVDTYIGGAEHATMHLIYARFFTKVLRDLGLLGVDEPFKKLFNQGMVHADDGAVMSKSAGNVIDPLDVSKKYGADALRLFLISNASPDKDFNWSKAGIEGSWRFLLKFVKYFDSVRKGKSSKKVEHYINSAVKSVEEDLRNMKYNFATITLRKTLEALEKEKEISKKDLEKLVLVLSPVCPHIAEELWQKLGNKGLISLQSWPEADEKKIDESFEKAEKAVDGTVSDVLNVLKIVESQNRRAEKVYLYCIPAEKDSYSEKELKRRIGLPVVVYAVNDKKKYDPQGKSKKARPGKPGIYLE